jgi:hypothetical protein
MRRSLRKKAGWIERHGGGAGPIGAGLAVWAAFDNLERSVLVVGSAICGFVCLGIGSMLGIPAEPEFNGSLLAGGAPLAGIIVIAVSVSVCLAIGLFVGILLELDAGLFCCCIGLAVLGVRCGPIRPVLQYASSARILLAFAVESALLGAILIGAWFGMNWIFRRIYPNDKVIWTAPNEVVKATLPQKLGTLGVQIVAMAICEQILIQTDYQAQSMAGVMISGFAGSLVAYMFRPLSDGIWYWTGPAVLGVIGYLLAFLFADGLAIGDLHGWAGPLARPTPLIYISMGTAGALVGYWCSRRWAQPEGDGEDAVAAGS